MKEFRLYNRIIGWLLFLIASAVYLSTVEPSTSLWDCGEFIASTYKLQVGHPPGAPFFMIMGRIFTLFTTDTTKVALMINSMSAIASALTIMFLFWSITHLALKLVNSDELKPYQMVAVLGSGIVGALAYTFSDTFWFSAVEGEVYASSSLFTAVVFWAILKWENEADEKYANRWIILIAYLMGLSIGVHLLNLLAIPAIVLVYYFKKYTISKQGLFLTIVVAVILLGGIMYVIIPGIIWLASVFELIFVNGFGLPYKTGVIVYSFSLLGGLVYGIYYTIQNNKALANTILLAITVIIIGYSSYAMIVIRSHANPPLDENSPETIFQLQSYLNREQYGDRPLFSGQYFNAPIKRVKEGRPKYIQKDGKYVISHRKISYEFDKRYTTFFPRMYSSDPQHIDVYLEWGNIKESSVFKVKRDAEGNPVRNRGGKIVYDHSQPEGKPSFAQNFRFFITYQLGHMYFRYFMWNFVGRQNDIQGHGGPLNGNWISGIPGFDKFRLGENIETMPDEIKNHPARNTYYFLPLLLGIIGLLFHAYRNSKDFWIVMVLFILTGIAIVVYLNQTPIQPRERDYAYAGSFYAFAIWVGLGVFAIIESSGKIFKNLPGSIVVTVLCLLLVPGIMANQNWDDHNRSGRYTARDLAYNYLNSCAPNAILFTNGDNDTFPLWYAQEVEGIRTDVRVVNLMLLNMDWYIDQMKRKAYESDTLPISMKPDQYQAGTRDMVYIHERFNQAFPAKEIVDFIADDDPATKLETQSGKKLDYIPTRNFILHVDSAKVIENGTVKVSDARLIENTIQGKISGNHMGKSDLIVFDILANNKWERPIYYVSTYHEGTLGLENYMQLDGFAYRLVPIKTTGSAYEKGRIDVDILYDKLMNIFKYGRMNEPNVYLDNFHQRSFSIVRLRFRFNRLANALIQENDTIRAEKVLDRIIELTPHDKLPYDMFMPGIAESYYRINKPEKANEILTKMLDISESHLKYYTSMPKRHMARIYSEIDYHLRVLGNISNLTQTYNQFALTQRARGAFTEYSQKIR